MTHPTPTHPKPTGPPKPRCAACGQYRSPYCACPPTAQPRRSIDRAWARWAAAIELIRAGDTLREAHAVGWATEAHRLRYVAAEMVWAGLRSSGNGREVIDMRDSTWT